MDEENQLDDLLSIALNNAESSGQPAEKTGTETIHTGDTDSSDDEDNRDFENQKYNECGRSIKQLLEVVEPNSTIHPSSSPNSSDWKPKNVPPKKHKPPKSNAKPAVDSHPIFGLRVVNPLVSGSLLEDRMVGKENVTFARIKCFVRNTSSDKDWVVAGVIISKITKTSTKNGKPYTLWTLSDLRGDLKTIAVFLFGNAHKELWKTAAGTAVGILNAAVLDNNSKKDEAALSIINPQRVMVLGQSKDFGVCKSTRKDGERCTAFINLCNGEHCIYHIQKEYQKSSLRQNLQASPGGRIALRNKVLGKNEVFYAGKSYTAIPAKKNKKQTHKDEHLLKSLSGYGETEVPAVRNERNVQKDEQLLKSLSENKQPAVSTKPKHPLAMDVPVLSGFQKQNVDLNAPASKKQIDNAKLNALKWVQRNGAIQKINPNSTKAASKKRPRESAKVTELNSKIQKVEESGFFSDRFKKMMAATSSNNHLLEVHEDEQAQKYFNKLEMREKMEQNMINTYKVVCKAVRCLKCKYTSFSASDRCKAEKHPLRVFDAVKRFFKCGNCGNRTVCLEIVPIVGCNNCGASKWERTGMMKERIEKPNSHLSIRGGEQTFVNSVVSNGNLDLLVPED